MINLKKGVNLKKRKKNKIIYVCKIDARKLIK